MKENNNKQNQDIQKPKTEEEESGLKLLYQPIYAPKEEKVFGYECLLRIVDSELGVLTPRMFLSVAEKNPNLIMGLETWAIEEIMEVSKQLASKGKNVEMLSLNISTKHILDPSFMENINDMLGRNSKPTNIYFEIKEEVLFSKEDYVKATLKNLSNSGFRIAIDDFGLDFFSVYRRRKPNFDMIKIDKSYIDTFLTNAKSKTIVETVMKYVKDNNLDVIAVGVERAEQEEALLELGCEKMQGYYYSKPVQIKRIIRKK